MNPSGWVSQILSAPICLHNVLERIVVWHLFLYTIFLLEGYFLIDLVCELVRANDSPITVLELLCFCSAIPLDIPEDSSAALFNDAAEEEAFHNQGMFQPHWNELVAD